MVLAFLASGIIPLSYEMMSITRYKTVLGKTCIEMICIQGEIEVANGKS